MKRTCKKPCGAVRREEIRTVEDACPYGVRKKIQRARYSIVGAIIDRPCVWCVAMRCSAALVNVLISIFSLAVEICSVARALFEKNLLAHETFFRDLLRDGAECDTIKVSPYPKRRSL